MDEMVGWHFSTGTLGYGDGRAIVVGETHEVSGPLELCERGLHASERIIDALSYAPGPMIYRVRLHGYVLRGDDKACATHRTYLAGCDATDILRLFARQCALDVVHLWDAPVIVREYLETGDESIREAAQEAAQEAAWAAWAARGKQNERLTKMVEERLDVHRGSGNRVIDRSGAVCGIPGPGSGRNEEG